MYSQPAQTHLTTSYQDRRKCSLPRQELVGPDPAQYMSCQDRRKCYLPRQELVALDPAHNILPRKEEMLSAKTGASGPRPSQDRRKCSLPGQELVSPARTGGGMTTSKLVLIYAMSCHSNLASIKNLPFKDGEHPVLSVLSDKQKTMERTVLLRVPTFSIPALKGAA